MRNDCCSNKELNIVCYFDGKRVVQGYECCLCKSFYKEKTATIYFPKNSNKRDIVDAFEKEHKGILITRVNVSCSYQKSKDGKTITKKYLKIGYID